MAQIAASIVLAMAAGVMPLAGQTSLSIYSDGRVVVRRTLPQALPKGRTNLALKLEGLDPATLFSPDTSVAVFSALLRPPTDREGALQRAVGQTLSFASYELTLRSIGCPMGGCSWASRVSRSSRRSWCAPRPRWRWSSTPHVTGPAPSLLT